MSSRRKRHPLLPPIRTPKQCRLLCHSPSLAVSVERHHPLPAACGDWSPAPALLVQAKAVPGPIRLPQPVHSALRRPASQTNSPAACRVPAGPPCTNRCLEACQTLRRVRCAQGSSKSSDSPSVKRAGRLIYKLRQVIAAVSRAERKQEPRRTPACCDVAFQLRKLEASASFVLDQLPAITAQACSIPHLLDSDFRSRLALAQQRCGLGGLCFPETGR